jgi:biotin carboxylase
LRTIIFIGTNKSGSSREAIKAAERIGYFTILFTKNERQLAQRNQYTDVHEMIYIDTNDIQVMKDEIKKLNEKGFEIKIIVSFVDSYVHIASMLCDEFCLNQISSQTVKIMENKEETRTFLNKLSFTPTFTVIQPNESFTTERMRQKITYPAIIKSPKSTGSKDVILVTNEEEFRKQMTKLRSKNPLEAIIAEEYIEGQQYLVEVIVYNQQILFSGVLEQEVTQGKRFIITGYGVHAIVPSEIKTGIQSILQSIITKFNIQNGAFHLELRKTSRGWKLIEINPRISGGAMNRMIQAAFGVNLIEETLKMYLGERPTLKIATQQYIFTQYIVVEKGGTLEKVTGKSRAQKSDGVVEVYIKPKKGSKLSPPTSMGHRYAYIIAKGRSLSEARRLAKKAAKEITFHLVEE